MEKELVEYIAKALVDNPDQVKVNVIEGEKNAMVELRVAPEDIGKVIGKGGRIARSIRVILGVVSVKLGKRISLEIIDN